MEGWRQGWLGRKARAEETQKNGRLPPFLPGGMVSDRSSPSRVRFAAQNAPLTAPGRSAHPPARKEREILGMAKQNLLDADRPSHGRRSQLTIRVWPVWVPAESRANRMLKNGSSLRSYNDFARRNGSGHCGDATMPRDIPVGSSGR